MLFKPYKIKSRELILKRTIRTNIGWYCSGCIYRKLNKCGLIRNDPYDPIFIFCTGVARILISNMENHTLKYHPHVT